MVLDLWLYYVVWVGIPRLVVEMVQNIQTFALDCFTDWVLESVLFKNSFT